MSGPADVGTLSTSTGAQLLVVPRAGGAVSVWESKKKILPRTGKRTTIKHKKTLSAEGSGVSGI
jgi:hypothetical protein